MSEVITTESLTKHYKNVCAVEDLNLRVNSGEIFGFSSTQRRRQNHHNSILTTLAKPSSGSVYVAGFDVAKEPEKVKKIIGVVQQHLTLDLDLNVRENLELHGRLHHIPSDKRSERIRELLEYVGLTDQSRRMIQELSGGMKKAAMIARSLMHKPSLLFLDEPTVGLDVQMRRRMSDLIEDSTVTGLPSS